MAAPTASFLPTVLAAPAVINALAPDKSPTAAGKPLAAIFFATLRATHASGPSSSSADEPADVITARAGSYTPLLRCSVMALPKNSGKLARVPPRMAPSPAPTPAPAGPNTAPAAAPAFAPTPAPTAMAARSTGSSPMVSCTVVRGLSSRSFAVLIWLGLRAATSEKYCRADSAPGMPSSRPVPANPAALVAARRVTSLMNPWFSKSDFSFALACAPSTGLNPGGSFSLTTSNSPAASACRPSLRSALNTLPALKYSLVSSLYPTNGVVTAGSCGTSAIMAAVLSRICCSNADAVSVEPPGAYARPSPVLTGSPTARVAESPP